MLKLEQGDRFERSKAEWLRTRFRGNGRASYEYVWARFIGNDGQNRLTKLDGLDVEDEERRQKFAEAHYSMALFAYLFDEVATKLAKKDEPIDGLEEYIQVLGLYSAVIAHLGQVCDMLEKIDGLLGANGNIHRPVENLHRLRSRAIHSVKLPMHQDFVGLRIPVVCDQTDPIDNNWNDKSNWADVNLLKSSQYLADFAKETQNQLFEGINAAYPIIYSQAEKSFLKQPKIGKGRSIYAGEESSTPPISQSASGDSGVFGNLQ